MWPDEVVSLEERLEYLLKELKNLGAMSIDIRVAAAEQLDILVETRGRLRSSCGSKGGIL